MKKKSERLLKNKKLHKRIMAMVLTMAITVSGYLPIGPTRQMGVQEVYGATRLTLSSAKSIAVANSDKIDTLEMKIDAKVAAKASAVRKLREKERNMRTFRWSPLLNFKFPTEPSEAQAFEFAFKPTQLEYGIKQLEHKVMDTRFSEYEAVSNLYIDIITYTAEIEFLKSRITTLSMALLKNRARVVEGTATQAQVGQQEKSLTGLQKDLAKQKKKLLKSEEKLGKKLGFKITSGYKFDEEFVKTNMNQDTVESLQSYALELDQTVYEAQMEMEQAKLTLEINYELIRNKYGNDTNMISGYVDQILAGSSVNKRAFRKDYDNFLKKIDEPWQGSWHILFISIPKEWFKGEMDGIRYVEDDPYVLYSAALDYQAALKEYNDARDELRSTISDAYDNLMEARDTYLTAQEDIVESRALLLDAEAKNALGTMSLEEYEAMREEYEASRSSLKDSLSTYSKMLYTFDRTTCGGASMYFAEESLATQTGAAGLGTPEEDDSVDDELNRMNAVIEKGATYSIRSIVDSQEFMLYVDVPENFEYTLTDFELWADGRQIGQRTAIGDNIRHMKLSVNDTDSVFIRLYNSSEFVDDCTIDPNTSYGPLNITTRYETSAVENLPVIGKYTVEDDPNMDRIKLRFEFDQTAVKREYQLGAEVVYYNIAAEKSLYLFSNDLIKAEDAFSYMSFIKNDIEKLTVRLFDTDGNYIGGAKFNDEQKTLYVDSDVTLEDMQEIAARQILLEEKSADLVAELKRMKDLYNAAKSVNTGEADSASVAYYKERIEKLQAKLDAVGDTITAEEISEAMVLHADEIKDRVATMNSENVADQVAVGLSAEEEAARDSILDKAARDYIKKLRSDTTKESVENAIEDRQKQIAETYRKYLDAVDAGNDILAAELKLEMDNLQKEIDVYNHKLDFLGSDDRAISDEEVATALMEFGDEIYATAADQLTDDMLYGSATGQWALAYLEARGFETSAENMRSIIAHAEDYQLYEALIARREALEQERKDAIALAERLHGTSDVVDSSCANQIDKITESYNRELAKLEKEIAKVDPGRDLIKQAQPKKKYKLFDIGVEWATAKEYCESQGGHLATITSKEEQKEIEKLLKDANRNSYWIGGYVESGKKWKWVTGEEFRYANWAKGQPDYFKNKEDKLMVYKNSNPKSPSNLGTWNDVCHDGTCNGESFFGLTNFGFICEWDEEGSYEEPPRYVLFDMDMEWSTAKAYCESQGGHLATITSKEEQEEIEKLLKDAERNGYWLGGYVDTGKIWKWVTGEEFKYTHWDYRQPDYTQNSPGNSEDVLMVYTRKNPKMRSGLGGWNDMNHDGTRKGNSFFGLNNLGFICEWD